MGKFRYNIISKRTALALESSWWGSKLSVRLGVTNSNKGIRIKPKIAVEKDHIPPKISPKIQVRGITYANKYFRSFIDNTIVVWMNFLLIVNKVNFELKYK